ncbi:MAG: DUF2202 domain-containing protein [Proteocatella sp.]
MRKNMKMIVTGFMAASMILSGFTSGNAVYAAENGTGAAGALLDSQYTLKEMLVYAIEDEYLAKTGYDLIIEKYGVQRPFSNITKAEARHIGMLLPLFEKYDISLPQSDWKSMTVVPDNLQTAYEMEIEAELKNIAMYEKFLDEDLNDDVISVFEKLMNASKNHLRAFQNAADGQSSQLNSGNTKSGNMKSGLRNESGNVSSSGTGRGNASSSGNKVGNWNENVKRGVAKPNLNCTEQKLFELKS